LNDGIDKTKKEYIKRINYVLDYIEKNLAEELSLAHLAKIVHYSPFHFHRLFSTIVGENLNSYINRKRIERIASILITNTKKPLKNYS